MTIKVPLATVLLAIVNLLLMTAVVWRLVAGSEASMLSATPSTAESFEPMRIALPPVEPLDEITALAVFHKSRSFYVPPPPPQMVVQPPPDYRLVGSMAFPGKAPSAMLVHAQTGARARVSTGDVLDGWKVAAINASVVTLQLDERTVEITRANRGGSAGMTVVPTIPGAVPAGPTKTVRVLGNASTAASLETPDSRNNGPARLYQPPPQ